jgi:hypothetical protein
VLETWCIRDDVAGESMLCKYMSKEVICEFFGIVCCLARDEYSPFCESAYSDHYRVVPFRAGEFYNMMDGYGRPRSFADG